MHTPPPNMYAAVCLLACAIARLGFALYIRQQQRQDAAATVQAAMRRNKEVSWVRKVDAELAEMRKHDAIKLAELQPAYTELDDYVVVAYTEPDDYVVVGNDTTETPDEWVLI